MIGGEDKRQGLKLDTVIIIGDPAISLEGIRRGAGDLNYSLTHSWSSGFQVEGKPWGREKDVFAFAVGQAVPSNDYKKVGTASILEPKAKPEGHLEAYYRIHVNDHLAISPDFQYIRNPFGKDVADDTNGIFVGGYESAGGLLKRGGGLCIFLMVI